MRARRALAWVGSGVAAVVVIVLVAVLVLTQTDWGRERVRGFALDRLDQAIDGEVEIGRIEGNLLTGVRLIDVAVRDREGRPFLEADTLEMRFGLRALLRQRVQLSDVRVVRAVVVLNQPPGEEWNYVRILPMDRGGGAGGWGAWIELDDVTLVDSRVTVRSEWQPPEGATAEERRVALRRALSGDAREHVVKVRGGYQNVMDFRELDAELPRVLVAHPDSAGAYIGVERLAGLVRPFSPPPARVRDLSGEVRIVHDSLFLTGTTATLPGSRLAGGAVYALHSGEFLLQARGNPVAFADLRWLEPRLPTEGGGEMLLRLELGPVTNRIVASDMDIAVGDATVRGRFDLTTGDTVRVGDTALRFARVETELVEGLFEIDLPRAGELSGELALSGLPAALRVDGDIRFDDRSGGTSRIVAAGGLGVEPELRFRELRLRFSPLQTGLARVALPDLPLRGTIEGTALLTGALASLDVDADLALRDTRHGLSRVALDGRVDSGDQLRLRDMVVRMDPLRLDLLRDELPELPAGATATGRVTLDGVPSRALTVNGDIRLDDPATGVSGIGATGALVFGDGVRFRSLELRFSPLQAGLARMVLPELPLSGSIEGTAMLTGTVDALDLAADLTLRDPRHGVSRIIAAGGLDRGDELRLRDMELRMDPLRLNLLRDELPELPADATLTGRVTLDGVPSRTLWLDGDVVLDDPATGVSELGARGRVAFGDALRFEDLRVRMEPLQVELLRAFAPDFPLGGTLSGTARLNGSAASRIAINGDVVHEEAGERSHVAGTAEVVTGPRGWAAVDVRLEPLSLDVAGRFLPGAGLHGSVAGRLQVSGDMGDLSVDADLRVADGGTIRAEGSLDLAADAPRYDLGMRLRDFDLSAVTWRAPAATDLTGNVVARGTGLDPATMRATIAADLSASGIDDVRADRVRLRAELDAGLARLDSSIIRLGGAEALLDGTFGLVSGREGVLSYRVAIDSLHAFATWLPGADTAVARPLPPSRTATVAADTDEDAPEEEVSSPLDMERSDAAAARRYVASDGALVTVNTTLVQTGIERPDREPRATHLAAARIAGARADSLERSRAAADTIAEPPTPRVSADSLAGSLAAAGTLRGNVDRFDIDGRVVVDDLVYLGAYAGAGEAEYTLAGVGTPSPDITLAADLRDVRTSTASFDSVSARGRYHGVRGEGAGEAVIVAHGTDDTEYRADAEFELSLERSELRLADLMLRHDTVTWRTARPAVVSWAGDAIGVARVDLVNDIGGRVRLDGRLPADGSGDMDVRIENLDLGPVVALLQLDTEAEGRLDLEAHVAGSLEAPRVEGTAWLDGLRLEGERVPDVRASLSYQGRELDVDATLLHDGRVLATADARLPVDLSLIPGTVPSLLAGELSVDVRADSLPIEAIPALSEHVADARGRLRGELAVRGTVADPVVTGDMELDLGAVRIVPLDLQLERVAGALRLEDGVLRVDSLVAHSRGPLRVTGEIGLSSLTDPTFGLDVEARGTRVIDTDDARLEVDADITVGGSLAAIEVSGEVRTRKGEIRIPELTGLGATEVVSLHSPAGSGRIEEEFLADQLRLDRRRPLLDRLSLDITLQVDRDVWLRSMDANVEIYTPRDRGPLHIRLNRGGTGLALEGTLNTDRGEYEFMSRRFDLTRGAATFIGEREINPVLQVAAEHEVRLPGREAFAIRVLLGGTVRDMEITLESTAQPPIAQTDLLSYLAFGRDAASLLYRQGSALSAQGGDAGELVGNVAGLATQQLGTIALDAVLGDVERELMEDLGVDVFRITPADLPPDMFTGEYVDLLRSTEVEAGKYLSSRLFVAGQINTGVTRPGVRVEYVGPFGVQWRTTWVSRWMPLEPTLTERDPRRTGVLGSFLLREWRF